MKVVEFSGGLNQKISPSKLQPNEATELVNADISSGSIVSFKGLSAETYASVLQYFHKFEAYMISQAGATNYVDYVNEYFYVDTTLKAGDGTTTRDVGLDAPTAPTIITTVDQPAPLTGLSMVTSELLVTLTWITTGSGVLSGTSVESYTVQWVHGATGVLIHSAFVITNSAGGWVENSVQLDIAIPVGMRVRVFKLSVAIIPTGHYQIFTGYNGSTAQHTRTFTDDGTWVPIVGDLTKDNSPSLPPLTNNLLYEYRLYDGEDTLYGYANAVESEPILLSVTTPVATVTNPSTKDRASSVGAYNEVVTTAGTVATLVFTLARSTTYSGKSAYKLVIPTGFDEELDGYITDSVQDLAGEPDYLPSTHLNGTYQYLITEYDPAPRGEESKPSALSRDALLLKGALRLDFDLGIAEYKRIYRVGGTLTQFSLVAEVLSTDLTYIDILSDSEIVGTLLASETYNVAPDNLTLLTEVNGVMLGAIGSKLHFSIQGLVFAWPPTNFIEFGKDITLIEECVNGIIVCTAEKTFIVTGNSPASYAKSLVSGEHGCISTGSYQRLRNGVIYQSRTALCFTTGGTVELLTKDKFNPLGITITHSVVYNNAYYATSGTDIFILNLTDGNFYTVEVAAINLGVVDGVVQVLVGTSLYQLFGGTADLSLTYTSPEFVDMGHSERKLYKDFYISIDGTFEVEILLGGVSVLTETITGRDSHNLKLPQETAQGIDLQVKITGTGIVYEYEWKVQGRQNGR